MYSVNRTKVAPAYGEKRPAVQQDHSPKPQVSFIQRLYLFGTNSSPSEKTPGDTEPRCKKTKRRTQEDSDSSGLSSQAQSYSVQRLRQFWNNRLTVAPGRVPDTGTSVERLSRLVKSATIGAAPRSGSPSPKGFRKRNGSISRTDSRHSVVRESLVPLYSNPRTECAPKPEPIANGQKRPLVAALSPDRESALEKRHCVALGGQARSSVSFPLATATPEGGRIHWAKRTELLGIRAGSEEQGATKMPIRTESYVNNFIGVVVHSVEWPDGQNSDQRKEGYSEPATMDEKVDEDQDATDIPVVSAGETHCSLNRKLSTPTRKVSFLNNGGPYNRRLLTGNGNKVAALTSKFNKLIQQDAGLLEEVRKRGGYIHKSGGVAYKIKEDNGDRKGSLRKRVPSCGNRTDESSDEVSSVSSKNSYRKTGIRKRPSLRKNIYRRPEWENSRSSLGVKKALEIFEPHLAGKRKHELAGDTGKPPLGRTKPKVPDKSEQVMQKTKEWKIRRPVQKRVEAFDTEVVERMPDEAVIAVPNSDIVYKDVVDRVSVVEVQTNESETVVVSNEESKMKQAAVSFPGCPVLELQEVKEKKKSKVSRIYERLTFRSSKKNPTDTTNSAGDLRPTNEVTKLDSLKSCVSSLEIPFINIEEFTEETANPEQKIIDALCTVNQRIDSLSKSFNDLTLNDPTPESYLNVRPNASFLFRGKQSSGNNSQSNIVEAVNTVVINKSLSMDDHYFPCSDISDGGRPTPSKVVENDYEMVSKGEEPPLSVIPTPADPPTAALDNEISEISKKIESFVFKAKRESDNIYQCVTKPDTKIHQPPKKRAIADDTFSINSYESFENYESIEHETGVPVDSQSKEEDTYEVCNPPEPPPPRSETRNDLTLPQPKRNMAGSPKVLPKHLQATPYTSNYERIKYSKIPPRPPKPEEIPLPPRNNSTMATSTSPEAPPGCSPEVVSAAMDNDDRPSSQQAQLQENIYEENIYDTIRSGDAMDYDDPSGTFPKRVPSLFSGDDTVSFMSSPGYESIGSRLEFTRNLTLSRVGSSTTLASDQITNSIYGTTGGLQSLTPPSERGSDTSNNSEDWTDISDQDDDAGDTGENGIAGSKRKNFIVVRERRRPQHTPLWTRKALRLGQQKIDDDSDHHYESLYSVEQMRNSELRSESRSTPVAEPSPRSLSATGGFYEYRSPQGDDIALTNDEEFDSFDSDNESDDDQHRKTDSGVDIRNAKLPDPPPSSGQVYALMQKIKYLGTLSKWEITKGLKWSKKKATGTKTSTPVPPVPTESSVGSATYENAVLPSKPSKAKSKSFKLPLQLGSVGGSAPNPPPEDYENTEFHKPVTPTSTSHSPGLASSPASEQADKSLLSSITSASDSSNVSTTFRKKSKSGKSLRSKLRKTLASDSSLNIGSSFNGSRSTFYVVDSLDIDSGIFNGSEQNSASNLTAIGESHPPKPPATTADASWRRSIALPTSRPSNPPPPPPVNGVNNPTVGSCGDKKTQGPKVHKLGATSWYAECGVFKQSPYDGGGDPKGVAKDRSTTSWYAGIYQTSGASVASSSESSGVSTGGEGGPGDDHSHSMFVNEPLYQIYNAAKLEAITRDIDAEITGQAELYDDGYEKISDRADPHDDGGSISGGECGNSRKSSRPSALELIEPNVGKLRTLWCEIPEVRNSEILSTLTPTEKRLQEAKFEILTSEASYLKSLNLLRAHFINHPAFRDVKILTSSERKTLFASIIPVQECSDRLLCDLENCWQDNIMLLGQSHSIYKHAEKHFHVYVSYCENQAKIDRTLKTLKVSKPEFTKTLVELEADPVCCSLSLSSFLMLPMQRITRMRLLLDAVLQRLQPDDDEFQSWEKTFVLINRILTQCNDAAHRSEQMHEMELISRQIEFPTHIRPLAIVPCGIGPPGSMLRKLEKRGDLVHLLWRGDDAKLTFGKKFSKSSLYAFLFTDLLVLTKKKSDDSFLVVDYCQRALLTVASGDIVPGLPTKEMQTLGKHLIIMTLLENYEGKTIEMILSCPTETERERWLMVTEPVASENPDEKIYQQWDCPQVIAVHPYRSLQPDELDLDIKDVVNVHRKMADGWYEGERIRDGAVGWFPGNYTREIPSAHIRAKHIKQRHMLLTYTSKYIDTTSKNATYGKK